MHDCEARIWKSHGPPSKVYLSRLCPEHGDATVCIASDARFYWLAQGNEANSGCGAGCACSADPDGSKGSLGQNANPDSSATVETLATCLALIEIVDSCNLSCPTCFAASPIGTGSKVQAKPLADLQTRINGVLERKGNIEILQLSGGEPTLHPEFFDLVDWIYQREGIDFTLVNTNGVRIARDNVFLAELGERARRGHLQLYLQFDGLQEEGQRELRGADLRELKLEVMRRCQSEGIPVTLATTVNEQNLSGLWEIIEFGLKYSVCRGLAMQPMFLSGRNPLDKTSAPKRLNTADLIIACVEQSAGKLGYDDFTPLPCGDPNCATIGYLLRTPIGMRSISEFVDFAKLQGFLQDKVRYELADLQSCGCENTELGELLHRFEMKEENAFRLFIKPFMDAWTWDQDRIDRCCTHVIRPDGKLDSFCRYYSGFPDAWPQK
ncbi:MAG: radical SAM protein [Rubritalea sp.]|uniref:radical SAM protein n=1 Tax=Rubritalea sp. TaxID=2109375 RepID=UPI003241C800